MARAIQTGRLVDSVTRAGGTLRIVDFTLADREWLQRTDAMKARGPHAFVTGGSDVAAPAGAPPLVSADQLGVFVDLGAVVFGNVRYDDVDRDYVVPMSPATARGIAEQLLAAARLAEADPHHTDLTELPV